MKRRFSDFLGLHDKLVHKHQSAGVVVPKPPEKSTVGKFDYLLSSYFSIGSTTGGHVMYWLYCAMIQTIENKIFMRFLAVTFFQGWRR